MLLFLKSLKLSYQKQAALSLFSLHLFSRRSCPRPCNPILRSLQSAANVRTVLPRSPSLDLKFDLLRQECFSPSQVTILQADPYFLAASFERVASFISFLRAKGIVGEQAGCLLTKTPGMLSYKVEAVERKCKFFEDLGVEIPGLQKLLTCTSNRTVLGTSIKTMQKHVDFLHRIGLGKQEIVQMILILPRILLFNVERKMEATVAFFERHGMSKDDFRSLVRSHPQVFGVSIDGRLREKLEFIRGLGLDISQKSGARALASWITFSPDMLISKWEFLKREGFFDADVHEMVKKQPGVLATSKNSLKRKIDFLKNVLNRDIREVAKFPAYFGLSLENRIVPRFTFLNEIKEKGESVKTLSLSTLLSPSNESFEKKHATGYAKWKARYNNEEVGDG